MRNLIVAFGIAGLALAGCSGGSGGSVSPAANANNGSAGSGNSSGSSTSTAGKAAVTITFAVPPKGSTTSATRRTTAATTGSRSPQWISPNTTEATATFTPTSGGSYVTGTAACTVTCTLQVFVTPGTYNVLVTAGDSNGPLSAGTATGFTVTLGAANTLTLSGPLTEVLATVQFSPSPPIPANVFNGQTTASTVTANLLDFDSNPLSQPGPWVDQYGTAVTGLEATPYSPSGTMTINAGTAPVPITATPTTLNVSYNGTEPVSEGATVSVYSSDSAGSVNEASISSNVFSPFDLAQTSPAPFNPITGAYTGDPEITATDYYGDAFIEYPLFISQAQTLTLTDNDSSPNNPISIDPSNCTGMPVFSGSFVAGGNTYSGSPISLTYTTPVTITYTINPSYPAQCALQITDSASTPNTYSVYLYFDQNELYVSSQKRKK